MNTDSNFLCNRRRRLSSTYAAAELIWYLSRTQSIRGIVPYANQYELFANDGLAMGAYGDRIARNGSVDQLAGIVELLSAKSNTRRAIVVMWNADDLPHAIAGDWNDIPCTLAWHLLVRGSSLNMICTMRSQDLWLGLPYDVFVNTTIQQMLANTLNLKVGSYTHQCGSLHLYEKHWGPASESIPYQHDSQPVDLDFVDLSSQHELVELERVIRSTRGKASIPDCEDWRRLPEGGRNLISCVAHWWDCELPCTSDTLRQRRRCNVDSRGN